MDAFLVPQLSPKPQVILSVLAPPDVPVLLILDN